MLPGREAPLLGIRQRQQADRGIRVPEELFAHCARAPRFVRSVVCGGARGLASVQRVILNRSAVGPVRKTGKLASVMMNSFMALDRATATKWQAQFGGEGKPN